MNLHGRKPKVILAMSELFTLLDPSEEHRHIEFARVAEEAGIEGLFVSEHVVMGPSAGAIGRPENPRQFVRPGMQDPATPWPAPLIKLAAMAGATSTIRLISAALIAPLRHPILLAKEMATMDMMTNGRFTVLPSVSWHDEEYRSLQIDFSTRGRQLDEHLAIWNALWEETPAAYDGEFYQFSDTYFAPKPRADGIKMWFGGTELRPSLLQRIATYADGLFLGFPLEIEHRTALDTAMKQVGRTSEELEITGWLVPSFTDNHSVADIDATLDAQLERLVDHGCDLIAIKPSCFIDDPDEMGEFCRHVLTRIDEKF
ncbi:F420-dependent oxidoreductase [Rhodococcus sp. ACPA4]|uniref:LLM class flavin-dependent oxidoreductase n=1 Tax=Rhodococcus sp. ACPA4 TaxID=2028571 RepID=UPI000BB1369D|nr:LLM class flavin-dependent oxidoreductase [Rhodococcus sp. ACPA4]PBC42472.1 F420-dependent oxidoreductase [Rhodococcus sp. ACPA4]